MSPKLPHKPHEDEAERDNKTRHLWRVWKLAVRNFSPQLHSLNVAADRLVPLENRFVAICPIRQHRKYEYGGFQREGQGSFISEADGNSAIFFVGKEFDVFHDLVAGFGEVCELPYTILSHVASLLGDLVRDAFGLSHRARLAVIVLAKFQPLAGWDSALHFLQILN